MERLLLSRSARKIALLAAVLVCSSAPRRGWSLPPQQATQQYPAPIERRPPSPRNAAQANGTFADQGGVVRRGTRGEHLAEWMNQHSSLTPEQQQQALEREPGFQDLPQPTRQRMLNRLAQLDAMAPQQRQRLLARNEAMERLTPDQSGEVRTALARLGNLPPEERRPVARTFRALRDLPPEQRISAYASGRYGPALSDPQREVLFGLLRVEPMLPPPTVQAGNGQAFH